MAALLDFFPTIECPKYLLTMYKVVYDNNATILDTPKNLMVGTTTIDVSQFGKKVFCHLNSVYIISLVSVTVPGPTLDRLSRLKSVPAV